MNLMNRMSPTFIPEASSYYFTPSSPARNVRMSPTLSPHACSYYCSPPSRESSYFTPFSPASSSVRMSPTRSPRAYCSPPSWSDYSSHERSVRMSPMRKEKTPAQKTSAPASPPSAIQGCCTIPSYTSGQTLVCQNVSSESECKSGYNGTWASGACPSTTKAYGPSLMGVRNCGCSDDSPLCVPLRTKASLQTETAIIPKPGDTKAKLFAQYLKMYGSEGDKLLTKTGSLEGVKNFNATADIIEKKQEEQDTAVLALNETAVLSKKVLDERNGFSIKKFKIQLKTPSPPIPAATKASLKEVLPTNFAWPMKGVVGLAKNQGTCGSCYVYAALSVIESGYTRRTGKMLTFSEQALLDMKKENKCTELLNGCDGGLPDEVIQCVANTNGFVTVEGQNGKKELVQTDITGVGTVFINNPQNTLEQKEMEIMKALFNHGPLCVAVTITDEWNVYYKGILKSPKFVPQINHAVVCIGWGYDTILKKKFWLIRNSWGLWGELGAIRLERGNPNDKTGPFRMYEYNPVYPIFSDKK